MPEMKTKRDVVSMTQEVEVKVFVPIFFSGTLIKILCDISDSQPCLCGAGIIIMMKYQILWEKLYKSLFVRHNIINIYRYIYSLCLHYKSIEDIFILNIGMPHLSKQHLRHFCSRNPCPCQGFPYYHRAQLMGCQGWQCPIKGTCQIKA